MIIGVVGRSIANNGDSCSLGTGKDTVSDVLVTRQQFLKLGLADPMKRFLYEVYQFSREQLWGSSASRNTVDLRYSREMHVLDAKGTCRCCSWDSAVIGAIPDCFLTPRYALQMLGTEWGRNCYNDTWVRYGVGIAHQLLSDPYVLGYVAWQGIVRRVPDAYTVKNDGVVISDCRFKNELEYIKQHGGKLMLVERRVEKLPEGADIHHQSERDLDEFTNQHDIWDAVLFNREKDALPHQVTSAYMALLSGHRATV